MAKINTGTITVGADGTWQSNAITLAGGAQTVYLRVNGSEVLSRAFTVGTAELGFSDLGQQTAPGLATGGGLPDGGTSLTLSTVPANTLVLVFVDMYCSAAGLTPAITAAAVGGNALTLCGTPVLYANGYGLLHLYRYYSSAGMTNPAVTTTGTVTSGNFGHRVRAWAVSGASSSQTGAGYNTAVGTGANPTVAVTASATGSVVFGAGALWTTYAAGANTEAVTTEYVSGSMNYRAFKNTQAVTSGNPFSINITEAGGDFWGLVATEIKV